MPKPSKMFFMENKTFDFKVSYNERDEEAMISRLNFTLSRMNPKLGGRLASKREFEKSKAKLNLTLRLPEDFQLLAELNLKSNSETKFSLLKNFYGLELMNTLFYDFRNYDRNSLKVDAKKQLSRVTRLTGKFTKFLNNSQKDSVSVAFKNKAEIASLNGQGFVNLSFVNQYNVNDLQAQVTAGVDARLWKDVQYSVKAELDSGTVYKPMLFMTLDSGKQSWGFARAETEVNLTSRRNQIRLMTQFQLTENVWWSLKLKNLDRLESCWGFQADRAVKVFQSLSFDLARRGEGRGIIDFGIGVHMNL